MAEESVVCSICLEAVIYNVGRATVRLGCNHLFHLDCIGSAFNFRREMQCPNCRFVEQGEWICPQAVPPPQQQQNENGEGGGEEEAQQERENREQRERMYGYIQNALRFQREYAHHRQESLQGMNQQHQQHEDEDGSEEEQQTQQIREQQLGYIQNVLQSGQEYLRQQESLQGINQQQQQQHEDEDGDEEEQENQQVREQQQGYIQSVLQSRREYLHQQESLRMNQQQDQVQQLRNRMLAGVNGQEDHYHIVLPNGNYWCSYREHHLRPSVSPPSPPRPSRSHRPSPYDRPSGSNRRVTRSSRSRPQFNLTHPWYFN